ncbi:MAG: biotin--[acetyl-CoA-carboxylase] ligase, partial [Peptostreptococcaceae bacterium]
DLELREKATSLKINYDKDFNRSEILSMFLQKFTSLFTTINDSTIDYVIKKYKANSCILNKKVSLHYNNTYEIVTPIDILNDGSLLVKDSNNIIKQIYSGEVSLRF